VPVSGCVALALCVREAFVPILLAGRWVWVEEGRGAGRARAWACHPSVAGPDRCCQPGAAALPRARALGLLEAPGALLPAAQMLASVLI